MRREVLRTTSREFIPKTMKNDDPPKMSSKDLGLSKEYAMKRKLELDQDLVFLLVSLSFY